MHVSPAGPRCSLYRERLESESFSETRPLKMALVTERRCARCASQRATVFLCCSARKEGKNERLSDAQGNTGADWRRDAIAPDYAHQTRCGASIFRVARSPGHVAKHGAKKTDASPIRRRSGATRTNHLSAPLLVSVAGEARAFQKSPSFRAMKTRTQMKWKSPDEIGRRAETLAGMIKSAITRPKEKAPEAVHHGADS